MNLPPQTINYERGTLSSWLCSSAILSPLIVLTAALPDKNPFGDGFSRAFWIGLVARDKGRRGCCPGRLYGRTCGAGGSGPRTILMMRPAFRVGHHRRCTGAKGRSAARRSASGGTRAGREKSLEVPALVTNLAWICAWTGERDLAIEQLEIVAKIPAGPTYGELRLDPVWDSLRGDPRFEKIVASLAPK